MREALLITASDDSKNLEKENSELRKALELSDYDKKENFKLAVHGANILADIMYSVLDPRIRIHDK